MQSRANLSPFSAQNHVLLRFFGGPWVDPAPILTILFVNSETYRFSWRYPAHVKNTAETRRYQAGNRPKARWQTQQKDPPTGRPVMLVMSAILTAAGRGSLDRRNPDFMKPF